uniref:U6 snRNA-associated Sm-like protein LSm1 n=1 Tax=Suricata suricatta TaxID=37032 RepID=A0A673T3W7_SURSU
MNYMPGTASLIEDIDKKHLVLLRDGRTLIGFLRSIDQFANLVLHQTVERIHVGKKYGDIPRGIFVVRGENVVLLGEIVTTKEVPVYLCQEDQLAGEKLSLLKCCYCRSVRVCVCVCKYITMHIRICKHIYIYTHKTVRKWYMTINTQTFFLAFLIFLYIFNFLCLFFERESTHKQGSGRERGRHRNQSRLQALSCQQRAQRSAQNSQTMRS